MTEMVKHKIQLILGGARSGKSALAEQYALSSTLPVTYIATAQALDAEMAQRIAQHQAERPAHWRLIEAPLQLSATIESIIFEASLNKSSGVCILVDCLTLWLSNSLCQSNSSPNSNNKASQDSGNIDYWQQEKQQFLSLLNSLQGLSFEGENRQAFAIEIILVSNEVGHGIVPMGELSRQFVDQAGWLHQAIAKVADQVEFVMAGLPLTLKSSNNISHKAAL